MSQEAMLMSLRYFSSTDILLQASRSFLRSKLTLEVLLSGGGWSTMKIKASSRLISTILFQ